MSKEIIIEKIMSEAEAECSRIMSGASQRAADVMSVAEDKVRELNLASERDIVLAKEGILFRAQTVGALDAKKPLLKAKTQLIEGAYETALEKLKNLPQTQYKKLILSLLSAAEDGDMVVISEREKGIITDKVIADYASKKGITLTLSKDMGSFDGGIMLVGKTADKDRTLEAELRSYRDVSEAEVVKILFEE
jgi:vacuolar-type H+-ATPase subunit E/Vma4